MAVKKATKPQVPEKKRVSKAVKRKAKKVLEPDDDEDDEPEEKAVKPAAGESTEAEKPKEKKRKTKANRFEEMAADAEKEPQVPRGVIYVGHIPDGFAEPQMRKFFSQFGSVTRLRISRSKKTARSKGYAFVEFEEEAVATIVAETMQGYLLFGKTLVCHVLPKDKCHPMLFKGCRRRMMNTQHLRRRKHITLYNDRPTVEVDGEQVPLPRRTLRQAERRKKSDKKLTTLLAELGVDYDIGGADGRGAKSPKVSPKLSPKVSPKASPKSPKVSPKVSPKASPVASTPAAGPKKKKRKVAA